MIIIAKNKARGNREVLVDDTDAALVSGYVVRWIINGDGQAEVHVHMPGAPFVKLHRLIVGKPPDGMVTDHINGNRFDNRRENLRWATPQQNSYNKSKQKGNFSSKYKGVCVKMVSGVLRYRVDLMKDSSHYNLGVWDNEVQAALAYDYGARMVFGEYARVNFPHVNRYGRVGIIVSWLLRGGTRRKWVLNGDGESKELDSIRRFIGVERDCVRNRWRARICVNGKRISLGRHTTAEAAAKAYDEAALKYFGAAAKLNFPPIPSAA